MSKLSDDEFARSTSAALDSTLERDEAQTNIRLAELRRQALHHIPPKEKASPRIFRIPALGLAAAASFFVAALVVLSPARDEPAELSTAAIQDIDLLRSQIADCFMICLFLQHAKRLT